MTSSGSISWSAAFGPWAALLLVSSGCQPDSPRADKQFAISERASQASAEHPSLPHGQQNVTGEDALTADETTGVNRDEDHIATAKEFKVPVVKDTDNSVNQLYSPQQHFEAGQESEQTGNTSNAIAHYTAALELDPDFTAARKNLGSLLMSLDRYVDASVLYGQLVERDPSNADAHNDWGVVLVRIGNLQEAIAQFREALRLKSKHPDAHYNLAVALLADGKASESIEHLIEALRIHPSYTDAYFTLGRAYLDQGKLDDAVAQFQHVMRLNREYEGLDHELGRAYIRQDNLKKAVQHFSEAVRRAPIHFEARYALGLALLKYGNKPGAVAQLTEAVRLEPESPDAHLQLAVVLARLGRTEEAIVHNERAISLRPEWPEALNNQAWLLATTDDERLRDPQRALDLAMRAKALADYKMPLVLDTLAAAQAAAGQFEQAQQTAAKAAEWAAAMDQSQTAEKIQQRLNEYRAGRPHRQSNDRQAAGDQ